MVKSSELSLIRLVAVLLQSRVCAHCAHCSLHNNVEQLQAKALTALPDQKSQIEISNYVLYFQNTEGAD